MPTNNKSIQILRGNKSSLSNDLKGTILKSGQPFFDKNAKTLQIGNGTDNLDNAPYVTVKDGAINDAKVASNAAIKGSKLANASNDESNRTGITTAKIEDSAVTTDKLANASITAEKIQKDAILKDAIKDGEVVQGKLGTNAVTESNIDTGAVTETKLDTDAVTTTKIKDRSITGDKLAEDFVFEQLGGQYTFTLSDGQFSEPTLEFADLHPSSNARVFLLANLEGKKDYQARLMLPTIADTEENTLATKEQIESGDIVAKTAQNATNATNAEKTDFSNAEWISVASGNTATFVNGGTYQITNPTVANAKTYISNIIYVPKHIETEIKFILGEYPSLTNDKQFWGVTEYHLILDTNFQAHVIRKSKPAGHDPYTDDLAFEYRRIR